MILFLPRRSAPPPAGRARAGRSAPVRPADHRRPHRPAATHLGGSATRVHAARRARRRRRRWSPCPLRAALHRRTRAAGGGARRRSRVDVAPTRRVQVSPRHGARRATLTFDVTNTGAKVTEFYLLGEDGLRIVGEVENIGPGLTRDLVVNAARRHATSPPASPA